MLLVLGVPNTASGENLADAEVVRALKQALLQGSARAVAQLGRPGGFLANARFRIPLPDSVQRADALARRLGLARYSDQVIQAMNRAAEQAVPEALPLLRAAVARMTLEDAHGILTGSDDAATRYFRSHTEAALSARFLPIVAQATRRARLADAYNQYARRGVGYGLVREEEADLDAYITRKALDALYVSIAEEERAIRRDPLGQTAAVMRKVFGSLLQ
ncbi:MAG TPA: DUF4197 domain-containing protein [Burkholderiales bacterium]